MVKVRRSNRRVGERKMSSSLRSLLDASFLFALATVTPSGKAHVNTAYFAWAPDFGIVWMSAREARHSRNLRANPSAAVAVFDSNQVWGNPDRGVQVFGDAAEVKDMEEESAERIYRMRFGNSDSTDVLPYQLYVLKPQKAKLFDEEALGPGVFVTARVGRKGELTWHRTEIYDSR